MYSAEPLRDRYSVDPLITTLIPNNSCAEKNVSTLYNCLQPPTLSFSYQFLGTPHFWRLLYEPEIQVEKSIYVEIQRRHCSKQLGWAADISWWFSHKPQCSLISTLRRTKDSMRKKFVTNMYGNQKWYNGFEYEKQYILYSYWILIYDIYTICWFLLTPCIYFCWI